MGATVDKTRSILGDNNEETNNLQIEEEIYLQINLIKLENLDAILLEEVIRKLDQKI